MNLLEAAREEWLAAAYMVELPEIQRAFWQPLVRSFPAHIRVIWT